MALPIGLLLRGAGLVALALSRSRGASSAPAGGEDDGRLSCEEARALCVGAIEHFVRASTAMEQETAAAWVGRYKHLVSETCPESVVASQPAACREAALTLSAYLGVRAPSEVDEDEEARLFVRLYESCPYLTAEGVFYAVLRLPDGTMSGRLVRDTPEGLQPALDELTAANRAFLLAHPETPKLYESGVRYGMETMALDDWNSIPFVVSQGIGDCEDLACWLAAEYQAAGVDARPFSTSASLGTLDANLLHVQVRLPDGRIEDPSARLGMRSVLPVGV